MKNDTKEIFNRFKKNKYLILLTILLSIICSLIVSDRLTIPVYQASAQVLIGGGWEEELTVDKYMIQEDTKFLDTYREIIESPYILSKVKEITGSSLSINDIKKGLSMEFEENSQVFSISVTHEDPKGAALLANAAAKTFVSEADGVMNANTLKLLDLADMEGEATLAGMGAAQQLAMAIIAGLCAGLGIAYVLPELDRSINNNLDAEELLHVPVIGTIPLMKKIKGAEKVQVHYRRNQL